MKRILIFLLLTIAPVCFAQNVRFGPYPAPSVSPLYPPLLQANLPPLSPVLAVCKSPANQVPCTNYATTYTYGGAACPNGAQDTPDPGATTSGCQTTGDAQGNIGWWAPPGQYDFTVCVQTTCSLYTVTQTVTGGGGGASITVNGGVALASPVNFQNGTNTTVSNPSGSNVQYNVTEPRLDQILAPMNPVTFACGSYACNWVFAPSGNSVGGSPTYNTQYVNNTAATNGTNVNGPSIGEAGTFWNGTSSSTDEWARQVFEGTGTNPLSWYVFSDNGLENPSNANVEVPGLVSCVAPWIDVTCLFYGADKTGVNDSSSAITSAFANCNGGTVFFPPGIYKQSTVITNTVPCTVYALPLTATINKNFSSSSGRPGASGSWLVESSDVTIDGLVYNGGQSSGFTGLCITVVPTSSTPITDIRIQNNAISNCDVTAIDLTSSASYTFPGPARVQVFNNNITCPASANAVAAILAQGTVHDVKIQGNTLDCSASTYAGGPAAAELESQGLTTTLYDFNINHNTIQCGTAGWGIQAGGFNGYQFTGLVIDDNILNLVATSTHGCVSVQATVGAAVVGNEFNANGFSSNYTALELIYDSGSQVTGNTFNWENSGTGAAIICNMCNTTNVASNKVIGFGETGDQSNVSAGIAIESTHNSQSLSGGTLTETGNAELITAPIALVSFWQPGSSVCISGATTTAYNLCGIIQNASYNRISGTFTLYNPTSGLASCSGACTTSAIIHAENDYNNFGPNAVSLPCNGTLTNNRYGIMVRATGTNEEANHNKFHNNTITGCGNGAAGDVGIRSTGAATEDSNAYNDNKLINLSVGYLISEGTTIFIKDTQYDNVTTVATLSGSPTFAQVDFGVPFADLVSCTAPLLGKTAEVTNNNAANTFGTTITGGGSSHVLARCSQSGNWTVVGGP